MSILVSRAPGKRQVKPTSLATENFAIHEDDSSSDDDFGQYWSASCQLRPFNLVHESDEESGSGQSGQSSEDDDSGAEDEEGSDEQSSSDSQDANTIRGTGKPVSQHFCNLSQIVLFTGTADMQRLFEYEEHRRWQSDSMW